MSAGTRARALIEKLDCRLAVISYRKGRGWMNVDAPAGQVFGSTEGHTLCVSWDAAARIPKLAAWEDLLEDLRFGLIECNTPDCDVCEATKKEAD